MLCIHKDPNKYLNWFDIDFRLKDPPEFPIMYLGLDISNFAISNDVNGVTCWAMSAYSQKINHYKSLKPN